MTRKLYRMRFDPTTLEALKAKAKQAGLSQTSIVETATRRELGLPPLDGSGPAAGSAAVKASNQTCCPVECCQQCDESCCAFKTEGGQWTHDCRPSSYCSKPGHTCYGRVLQGAKP